MGLGETGHGFESINQAKATTVTLLKNFCQFRAIAFESSFTASVVAYLAGDAPETRARHFLYPFWNTPSVNTALGPFFGEERTSSKPLVMGFDVQEDCRFTRLSRLLTDKQWVTVNIEKLLQADSILSRYIGKTPGHNGPLPHELCLLLQQSYETIAAEINEHMPEAMSRKLLVRSMDNRKWLCKYLTYSSVNQRMHYRDSLMADNIVWLKKELYAKDPFIIWAANTHIAKGARQPEWTGEWLSVRCGNKYFSIAFQKGDAPQSFLPGTTCKYVDGVDQRFDLIVYLEKLARINAAEWVTPCE